MNKYEVSNVWIRVVTSPKKLVKYESRIIIIFLNSNFSKNQIGNVDLNIIRIKFTDPKNKTTFTSEFYNHPISKLHSKIKTVLKIV